MIQIALAGNTYCLDSILIIEHFHHVRWQRRFFTAFRRKRALFNRQIDESIQGIRQIVAHPLTEIFFGQLLEIKIGILSFVERISRRSLFVIIGIIRAGKDDVSAGLEHTPDLLKEQFGVIEMLDRLKRADHIEGMIFKRELLRGVACTPSPPKSRVAVSTVCSSTSMPSTDSAPQRRSKKLPYPSPLATSSTRLPATYGRAIA